MEHQFERVCAFCGEPRARLGTTIWETGRSGVEVAVRGVPAYVCDACGESGVPGLLAVELSDAIERLISAVERHSAARASQPTGIS